MRAAAFALVLTLLWAAPARADRVLTVRGAAAPGPDTVRVLQIGPPKARHVLVLEPGTQAGAAYFRPVAADLVKRLRGWQVWAVDRRENAARGPLRARRRPRRQGDAAGAVRLLRRLARRRRDHRPLHAGGPGAGGLRPPLGHAAWRCGDLRRVIRRARAAAGAAWCSAGTRWARRSPSPTPPGTSAGTPARAGSRGLVLIDGGAAGRRRRATPRAPSWTRSSRARRSWTCSAPACRGRRARSCQRRRHAHAGAIPAGPSVAAGSPLLPGAVQAAVPGHQPRPVRLRAGRRHARRRRSRSCTCTSARSRASGDPRDWQRRRARHGGARRAHVLRPPRDGRRRLVPPAAAHASTPRPSTAGVRNPAQRLLGLRSTRGARRARADLRVRDLARRPPRARRGAGAGPPLPHRGHARGPRGDDRAPGSARRRAAAPTTSCVRSCRSCVVGRLKAWRLM